MVYAVSDYQRDQTYYDREDFQVTFQDEGHRLTPSESPLFNAGAAWLTLEALTNVNRPEELNWHFVPSVRKVFEDGTSGSAMAGQWGNPKYLVVWKGARGRGDRVDWCRVGSGDVRLI